MIEKWKNTYSAKYKLKNVGNIYYLVQIGEHQGRKKILKLNETGAFVWKILESCDDMNTVIESFCKTYHLSADNAYTEIIEYINFCNNNL